MSTATVEAPSTVDPTAEAGREGVVDGDAKHARGGGVGGVELTGTLASSFVECPICLQLLCEPLTTPCGHSFCRPCLVSTLRKNKKKCPTCRAVCHMEPESQSESIVLSSIIKSCFPSQYESRQQEIQREKESWSTILPIFYYNDTLFPYSCLSLHLFEERYKVMIRRIVETSRKFCYLPNFANYQASVGDIGVIAEITDVEFMANGRANLQAKCKERFRIVEHWIEDGTQGLHWCKVELLRDSPASEPSVLAERAAECKVLFQAFVQHCGDAARAQIDATYGNQPDDPEVLLETRTTVQRLKACNDLMSNMLSNAR